MDADSEEEDAERMMDAISSGKMSSAVKTVAALDNTAGTPTSTASCESVLVA